MQIKNPHYREHVERIFEQAAHIRALGIQLTNVGPGWCEAHLDIAPHHLQQTHVVHAGVVATLADHTAGAASSTLLAPDEYMLTAEFKINLLRPAQGKRLWCRAQVLKPGRLLSVAESEVFASSDATTKLVAKAMVTLAVLKSPDAATSQR